MDPRHDALRALCGSDSRFRVFKALYEEPEKEHHLRGLAAAACVDPSHVHKLLPRLIEGGLCEQVEATPYPKYRAKRDNPLFGRLRELLQDDARQEGPGLPDIDVEDAPLLRSLLWTGQERARIPAREAFQLYERNWRFIRRTPMTVKERKLVDRLAKVYGAGLING